MRDYVSVSVKIVVNGEEIEQVEQREMVPGDFVGAIALQVAADAATKATFRWRTET